VVDVFLQARQDGRAAKRFSSGSCAVAALKSGRA
jgi:hypothetical protein